MREDGLSSRPENPHLVMFGKATVHWAVLSDSSLNLIILDRCASEPFLAIAIYSFNFHAWDAWCYGSIVLIDVYESFDC